MIYTTVILDVFNSCTSITTSLILGVAGFCDFCKAVIQNWKVAIIGGLPLLILNQIPNINSIVPIQTIIDAINGSADTLNSALDSINSAISTALDGVQSAANSVSGIFSSIINGISHAFGGNADVNLGQILGISTTIDVVKKILQFIPNCVQALIGIFIKLDHIVQQAGAGFDMIAQNFNSMAQAPYPDMITYFVLLGFINMGLFFLPVVGQLVGSIFLAPIPIFIFSYAINTFAAPGEVKSLVQLSDQTKIICAIHIPNLIINPYVILYLVLLVCFAVSILLEPVFMFTFGLLPIDYRGFTVLGIGGLFVIPPVMLVQILSQGKSIPDALAQILDTLGYIFLQIGNLFTSVGSFILGMLGNGILRPVADIIADLYTRLTTLLYSIFKN